MKKRLILLCIILFPSLFYLFFEMTRANFKKMAYFGPKTARGKGDTIYYSVPGIDFFSNVISWKEKADNEFGGEMILMKRDTFNIDTTKFPVYIILFLDNTFRKEGYKLAGLYDFINYKPKELKDVPIFIAADFESAYQGGSFNSDRKKIQGDFDSLKITMSNFHPLLVEYYGDRKKFLASNYFKQKPIHVFDYFAVLVDKQRHVRGYYDLNYNAEVKRMVQEYQHLKIRDEYAQTEKQNDIQQK